MDKIEVLKEGIVSVSQKKCASESKVAKASKQMRERGDLFEKLEEEKVNLEEQIKWKNEQFKHLEEAHERIRNKLRIKEKEWDMEKSSFFDEISTPETKLDSQITLSEDLKRRLEISNQDLAHEQNLRKAQIQEASRSSAVEKLQKKLKTLEQIHSKCESQSEIKVKVKEAEWRSQMEKMVADLNSSKQELKKKDSLMLELTMEKEEYAIMVMALKSTLLEARSKINSSNQDVQKYQIQAASNSSSVEKLQKEFKTLEQIHSKCESQSQVKVKEAEWRSQMEKTVSDLNSFKQNIEKKESLMLELTLEKELESSIMMVALKSTILESRSKINEEFESKNLDIVKVQESMKKQHEEEMKKVCNLLDMANEEVADRCCDLNELKFELQIWKSIAENLKVNSEVNHQTRRELEASLLSQVAIEVNLKQENEEKDKRINELEESKKKESLDLQKIMKCLEEEFKDSSASFSSQLSKMQNEMNLFHEAWEKIRTSVVVKEIEVEVKDLMIVEMEKDLKKMFLEKEKLVEIIGGVSERINKLSREDGQMMGTLRSIVMSFDEKDGFDPVKENTNVFFQSPKRRSVVESGRDCRSPLRALNS